MNTSTLLNNRYQIKKTIGKGGFSETFLAVDTHLPSGKQCVIKQLKPIIHEPTLPQWMCDRFDQEARILEELGENHQQIPCLYAYFQEDNNFYLVQEWIEGETLTDLVNNQGVFSEEKVEQFLQDILPVIEFVHSRKIIHRDIKPDNIIYRIGDDLPVLIDFGIVKETLTTCFNKQGNSAYSIAIGTPGYMAGEQAAGRPIYSSDLYSLALTCVYLLTGKAPQSLKTDSRSGEILWRQELPHLHSNLAGVIDRAICYNPRERFASASEMLGALNLSAQSYTHQPTMAVGGKQSLTSHPQTDTLHNNNNFATVKPPSQLDTYQPTVAVNSHSETDVSKSQQENSNWFLTFLPLISLSLVAIASFFVGYNLLVNQEQNSQLDNNPNTSEQNLPTETETNIDDENLSESEESINNEIETEENSDDNSTTPPETPITAENPAEIEQSQPPQDTSEETPTPDSPPKTPINSKPETSGNNQSLAQLPIAPIGTSATNLMAQFGSPQSKTQGSLDDTTKWSYRDKSDNVTVINYIVKDSNTQVQEVEMLLPANSSLDFVLATVTQLTNNEVDLIVREALREVVEGKRRSRSFYLGGFKGTLIVKNSQIYLNIRDNNP